MDILYLRKITNQIQRDIEMIGEKDVGSRTELERVAYTFVTQFENYVIWEDDDLLVVSKPSGVRSHNCGAGVLGLIEVAKMNRGIDTKLAHRLDKDTSGLVVMGKTHAGLVGTQIQFREPGWVEKEYRAFVDGAVVREEDVVVDLGYAEGSRTGRALLQPTTPFQGKVKPSLTRVRPGLYSPRDDVSMVHLSPKTGRTHQLRIVMADVMNAPILGDPLYKGDYKFDPVKRLMLHSERIAFEHPVLPTSVELEAPLHDDMASFEAMLVDL